MDLEESKIFHKILSAFTSYAPYAKSITDTWKRCIKDPLTLSLNYQCIDANQRFINAMVEACSNGVFLNVDMAECEDKPVLTEEDMSKVNTTLKQLVRDWSLVGKTERLQSYDPILNALEKYMPDNKEDKAVLVPGAGLGRLAFEIVLKGYKCQANEFSYHMLLASFFILNCCNDVEEFRIYPYILNFADLKTSDDRLMPVDIPDINPGLYVTNRFSMCAGDFNQVYKSDDYQEKFNCVATCFFIDTAKNILDYIRIIHRILKPSGIWINHGPLTWHYSSTDKHDIDISIKLSMKEIFEFAIKMGFSVLEQNYDNTCEYTSNKTSLLDHIYQTSFSVLKKG